MIAPGFADLHQHVLWGLDDGPQSPQEMHALLRAAAEDGIGLIAATAHADPAARPFPLSLYYLRLAEANAYCQEKGLPLRLVSGCEILYCDSVPDLLLTGKLLPLGGSRLVLIEFPPRVSIRRIQAAAEGLYQAGYRPVLAHVERYKRLTASPRRALALREDYGLYFQVNCAAALRPRGLRQRRFIRRLLAAGAVDLLATDAHNTDRRAPCMRPAARLIARRWGRGYAYRLSRFGKKIMIAETGEDGYNVTGESSQTESFPQNAGFLKQP